jgi:hypothetical protein
MLPSNTATPHDLREANLRDPLPDVGDVGSYAVYLVQVVQQRGRAEGGFLGRPGKIRYPPARDGGSSDLGDQVGDAVHDA